MISVVRLNFENGGSGVFLTPHIFADGPHLVPFTRLRPTKTGSKKICTPLSYRISPLKNFGYGVIYEKVLFFTDFLVRTQKKGIGLVFPQF